MASNTSFTFSRCKIRIQGNNLSQLDTILVVFYIHAGFQVNGGLQKLSKGFEQLPCIWLNLGATYLQWLQGKCSFGACKQLLHAAGNKAGGIVDNSTSIDEVLNNSSLQSFYILLEVSITCSRPDQLCPSEFISCQREL